MQKFSQQGTHRAPLMISSFFVEHFLKRMRIVSDGNTRTLLFLEEIISDHTNSVTLECAQHVDARKQDLNDPPSILPVLITSPETFSASHRLYEARV